MDIREYYKQAGAFHGHWCPGLAIGVRAACEAGQALGTQMADRHNHIQCLAESTACWLDGIQFVLGSTLGNGALKIDDTGKSAFSFYNPETGESLRYYLLELPRERPREELIDYILSAPLDSIFRTGPVRRPFPPRSGKAPEILCPRCGEKFRADKAHYLEGQALCPHCGEEDR